MSFQSLLNIFRSSFRRRSFLHTLVAVLLMPGLGLWTLPLQANPTGGVVVHGDVSFGGGAGNLQINQSSQQAIINWADFSIDAGELTQFNQPGVNAAVLNRVTGGNPSAIHGALKANGNVFVINPNGILVGANGTIDVHGLALSTLDVSNGEFLAGGDMVFKGAGEGVTNMGKINAIGGDVFLIGKTVTNSGTISAGDGLVGIAAGEEVLLKANADANGERIFVRAAGSGVSGTGILNDGTIEGAAVELKAHGNMYALAINNKGSIRATGSSSEGGRVFLNGLGGSVENGGSIKASAPSAGNSASVLIQAAYAKVDGTIEASGGDVRVSATEDLELGGSVDVSSSTGRGGNVIMEGSAIDFANGSGIDASGFAGGGYVRVGGGFQGGDAEVRNAENLNVAEGAKINVDATGDGDAGSAIFWADGNTLFEGEISGRALGAVGNGGFAEVSGKANLTFQGSVDLGDGTLLLDPDDFVVDASNSGAIESSLNAGTNVVIYTNPADTGTGGSGSGHIRVLDDIETGTAAGNNGSLSLLAAQDIYIVRDIRLNSTGGGDLNLVAGWDGTTGYSPGTSSGSAVDGFAVDMETQFFDQAGTYGNNNGSIVIGRDYVGGTAPDGVSVGSRAGSTNAAGYNFSLLGGNLDASASTNSRFAQFGYRASTSGIDPSGDIRVQALNDVTLTANQLSGPNEDDSFAMIGHGGIGQLARQAITGDITVEAGNNIDLNGGLDQWNFAQIGHGGRASNSSATEASLNGDIKVEAGNLLSLDAGTGNFSFARIGLGGLDMRVNATSGGDIDVDAGSIIANAGLGGRLSEVQIGHGGFNAEFVTTGSTSPNYTFGGWFGKIDVTTTSGGITFTTGAERSGAQIGHGGGSNTGNHGYDIDPGTDDAINSKITIQSAGAITFDATTSTSGNSQFAQVGHGGWQATGSHVGDIEVSAAGAITFKGGSQNDTYAMIGNGGNEASGDHAGNIDITAGGTISFTGGTGTSSSAMIGNGGNEANGDHVGDIEVSAAGAITFKGGSQNDTYAMIGNGGNDARGDHAGDIDVTAGGTISFTGGTGTYSGAMVGHGGFNADSADGELTTGNTGNISVTSTGGDIQVKGSDTTAEYAYAMIGHGGGETDGANTGHINLDAAGALTITSGSGKWGYARVGHGGYNVNGDHAGDIFIHTGTGLAMESTTGGQYGLTQIGHGGYRAAGAHSGFITLINDTGDISLKGADGGTNDRYSQIGHGGVYNLVNTLSGSISVVNLDGDIKLNGGDGSWRAAVIGHGSQSGHADGNRVGGLNIYANGAITMTDGTSNSGAVVGHQTGTNDGSGGVIGVVSYAGSGITAVGDSGFSVVATEGITFGADMLSGANSAVSLSETIGAAIADGDVTIAGVGDLTLDAPDAANPNISFANHNLTIASTGSLQMNMGFQNTGTTGDMLLIGGWDASKSTIASPLATVPGDLADPFLLGDFRVPDFNGFPISLPLASDAFGNSSGGVTINGAGLTGGIGIGSRGGLTSVYGNGVSIVAGDGDNESAQIGFVGDNGSAITGGLNVFTKENGLTLTAGGNKAYAKVGHLGHSGLSTTVDAAINVDLGGVGSVDMDGGTRVLATAQIGHGGFTDKSNTSGAIRVVNAVDISLDAGNSTNGGDSALNVRIGHGGHVAGNGAATTVRSGAITLEGSGDLRLTAGTTNGSSDAQIGHGGYGSDGAFSGDLSIDMDGAIELTAGSGSAARIGHGGRTGIGVRNGDIMINQNGGTGGDITLTGGSGADDGEAQIGHGGNSHNGDIGSGGASANIEIDTGGFVILNGGGASHSYAQIGHLGYAAKGDVGAGDRDNGSVRVQAGSGVRLEGGSATDTYAQIGHGGRNSGAAGTGMFGNVEVKSTNGDIELIEDPTDGASAVHSYTQIGHGGINVDQGFSGNGNGDFSGNVTVEATGGSVIVEAGVTSRHTYSKIGHGGYNADADEMLGDIRVVAGKAVKVAGGAGQPDNFANIGHGGRYSDAVKTGDITVIARENVGGKGIEVLGGDQENNFAQIGHAQSSANTRSDASGDITINESATASFVEVRGGSFASAPARIGHGGIGGNSLLDGKITIFAGAGEGLNADLGLVLAAGTAAAAHASIGHGGQSRHGAIGSRENSDIAIESEQGISLIGDTTNGSTAITQIGHGGWAGNETAAAAASLFGSISVTAKAGDINIFGATGTGSESFTQIGHGGLRSNYNIEDGSITVAAMDGSVILTGSDSTNASRIGHGGRYSDGDHSGSIEVYAMDSVELYGGSAGETATQIGHGGSRSYNDEISGDICVHAETGQVLLDARPGGGAASQTQIGHGGLDQENVTVLDGDITVMAGGTITLIGGDDFLEFAQIGHGGRLDNLNGGPVTAMSGDIDVISRGGNVLLQGGGSSNVYAGIGHRHSHALTSGTREGGIHIFAEGDITAANGVSTHIFHQLSGSGGSVADYLGGDGFQVVSNGTTTITNPSLVGLDEIISKNMRDGGPIDFAVANDIDITVAASHDSVVDTSSNFRLLTGGNITMLSSYQNSGDGEVVLVGGWNGDKSLFADSSISFAELSPDPDAGALNPDFCAPIIAGGDVIPTGFNDCEVYGVGGGSVTIGSVDQTAVVSVGSRQGLTAVYGDSVALFAGSAATSGSRLGFTASGGSINGDIAIGVKDGAIAGTTSNGLLLQAGGSGSFSQIGHEAGSAAGSLIDATISISFCETGDLTLAGGDTDAFSQIGHRASDAGAVIGGGITMSGLGNLSATGGSSKASAQIGHGGYEGSGSYSGLIDIDAENDILVKGGSGDSARAQIGHGGTLSAAGSGGTLDGIINVTSETGSVSVTGGSANRSSAQIGHGGDFQSGAKTGAISVEAGDGVLVEGGSNIRVGAQIGHGGYQAEGSADGNIEIAATGGNIDILGGSANGAYAQIGHGGVGNTIATVDAITGTICVHADAGQVTLDARPGSGSFTYTQIGHGGRFSRAVSLDGDITVVGNGNVLLQGGEQSEEYAQIGHGGRSVAADMSGDINVISRTGDLDILGGTDTTAYAMVGHGDSEGQASSGQREGGIHLFADGHIVAANGNGVTAANGIGNANIYHQTSGDGNGNGLTNATYDGGNGYQVVANGGLNLASSTINDQGIIMGENAGNGPITFIDTSANDYTFDLGDRFVNSTEDFIIIVGGSITMLDSYQNAGIGDVILVAGVKDYGPGGIPRDIGTVEFLNGSFCEPIIRDGHPMIDFNNCENFGNDRGSGYGTVTIGAADQTAPVYVGSRAGTNTIAAYGLTLLSNDGNAAQFGFRPDAAQAGFGTEGTAAATGDININLKAGGLNLTSGAGTGSYTQIGHGGAGSADSSNGGSGVLGGDITISFCEPGAVTLLGGGADSYAQIGHGGAGNASDITGTISIGAADAATGFGAAESITLTAASSGAYTQIGHGGLGASGSVLGDINLDTNGALAMTGGNGNSASTQIGHGGFNYNGALQGNIAVNQDGGAGNGAFTLTGGRSGNAFTMLGHGGVSSVGTKDGSITLRANDSISIIAPGGGTFASAHVGHGGQSSTGLIGSIVSASNIDLTTNGEFLIRGNVSGSGGNYTQVGHGGQSAGANGETVSGSITLTNKTAGNISNAGLTLIGSEGGAGNTHTQIGHGGYGANYSTSDASIKVDLGGDLLIVRSDTQAQTQIGHGGEDAKGDYSGAIDIDAVGAITLGGRAVGVNSIGAGNIDSSVQIGHGGSNANGAFGGDINVDASGTIALLPGDGLNGSISDIFTQIGHGGSHTSGAGNASDGDKTGNISVTSTGGDITLGGGLRTGAFTQIGHGGSNAGGDKQGTITLSATNGSVDVEGGNAASGVGRNYAQVGHGGETGVGSVDGAISVTAGNVTVNGPQGGAASNAYGQIGHGGAGYVGDIGLNLNSDISVTGTAGNVSISGGVGDTASRGTYGQIGHGGSGGSGTMKGAIDVNALGAGSLVSLEGGSGTQTYAQLGHGGTNRTGDVLASNITVNATGGAGLSAISVTGGEGSESYAMIGHGGDEAESAGIGYAGDIEVTAAAGDIDIVAAGDNNRTYAKIGHGAYNTAATVGAFVGDVTVTAEAGSVIGTAAENGNNNFVQIGHGGIRSGNGHSGTIEVLAANDITFQAGTNGNRNDELRRFAMIGHGGHDVDGDHGGAITVAAGTDGSGSVSFTGGDVTVSSTAAFAQIGHGGEDSSGDLSGNLLVTAADNVTLQGGDASEAYSQIGHGGRSSKGDKSGTITVTADNGTVELLGGGSGSAYAQIGHGGHDADFTGAVGGTTAADTITVTSSGAMVLRGTLINNTNAAAQAYAQIGHGGQYSEGNHLANIIVNSGGTLDLIGGESNQSYAQIGHGGLFNGSPPAVKGNQSGNIDVDANGTINLIGGGRDRSYAQIGHGGNDHDGNLSGSINVDSATGAVNVLGNGSLDAYSQIGHGGNITTGSKDGNIVVNAATGVKVAGSGNEGAYGQIGHGGDSSNGMIGANAGDITVTSASGNIDLPGNQVGAGTAYSQIGHGGVGAGSAGESANGIVKVTATSGGIFLTGSNTGASGSYVQIGHGGLASAYEVINQMIDIDATGGAITVKGGGAENHTMIGHGGERSSGGVFSGLIDIDARDDITLNGGRNADASAQIGHGGTDTDAAIDGAIEVTSTNGKIATTAGANSLGTYTQVGHGGTRSQGTLSGAITVEAGTEVNFATGVGTGSYTQIGHGGLLSITDRSGAISVTANDGGITFSGSGAAQGYAQLGHGGDRAVGTSTGDITANAKAGDVSFTAGSADRSYALLGHGGIFGNDVRAMSGSIDVDAAGDVRFTSGGGSGNWKFAQLGHGGLRVDGDKSGAISVDAGGIIDFTAATASGIQNYVQLGHGGYQADGDYTGAITATALGATGALNLTGGGVGSDNYAQMGHGGTDARGTFGGDIIASTTNDILLTAGNGVDAYAQIGHGGSDDASDDTEGDKNGEITVATTSGNVALTSSDTSHSQIGHGGFRNDGDFSGGINIDAGGTLTVTAGADDVYAQVGHGGNKSVGSKSGAIDVAAASVLVEGGSGTDASARIGSGGSRAAGDIDGAVKVVATAGDVEVKGGSGNFADAAIGAGGFQYVADSITSATTVTSFNDVIVSGGTGIQTSAQIGAGGLESTADAIAGDVSVTAGNDIRLTGGNQLRAYSQIGNGGATADGDFSGMIDVISGNDILLTAANGAGGAYAKIGHGDDLFSQASSISALAGAGARSGDIKVSAASDIALADGMIGHVNQAATSATGTGSTQIAVSTTDPTDPAGGSLVADSDAEFAGPDELRFYLPERSNNEVQAGAFLNGVAFEGAETDPSEVQRDDEFTVLITGDQNLTVDEHENAFDTGPAPSNAGNFAFYYNSIALLDVPDPVDPGTDPVGGGTDPLIPGGGSGPSIPGQEEDGGEFGGFSLFEFLGMFPDDKSKNDWLREREEAFTGFNSFRIFFEGYEQYDLDGNPVFQFPFSNFTD